MTTDSPALSVTTSSDKSLSWELSWELSWVENWVFSCSFRSFELSSFVQNCPTQLNGFYLNFRCESSEILLPHKVHLNGFSAECALKCSFRCESSENVLPHKMQLNGFTSECPLKCSFSCESLDNLLPHKVQLNGFSSEMSVIWNVLSFVRVWKICCHTKCS